MPVRRTPKTTKEAFNMIKRAWLFLLKRNPAVFAPLTFWMIFGGFIFLYNYVSADKFTIKEAKPIGQVVSPSLSLTPQAFAEEKADGPPIVFDGKVWGYEDVSFIVKAVSGQPVLLVYDTITKKVYEVEFAGRNYKMQR
jgi:hypothetical protein